MYLTISSQKCVTVAMWVLSLGSWESVTVAMWVPSLGSWKCNSSYVGALTGELGV